MCKGADSVLLPLLKDRTEQRVRENVTATFGFMEEFASNGLRTLLFVEKQISAADYEDWLQRYNEANLSILDREGELERVSKVIEDGFELVGSTAIEDKLQDGVPEIITMLKSCGIKLWVLTGDKIETAINIGYSCGLLEDAINQYVIDATRTSNIREQINDATEQHRSKPLKRIAVIVGGDALLKIFLNDGLKESFLDLTDKSTVVLACRVSPL